MGIQHLRKDNSTKFFLYSLTSLSLLALSFELIPEIPAKILVVSTLGLVIFITIMDIMKRDLEIFRLNPFSKLKHVLLSLAILGMTLELLPEVHAKVFVVPILVTIILFSVISISKMIVADKHDR